MLYLISTPIGNLGDISDRAKSTLQSVDLIACEDTRTTRQLLTLLGLKVPKLVSYHEHNEKDAARKLVDILKTGQNVALVCDAGTPLISDPGYNLIQACHEHAIPVTAIPGANAVLTAVQLAGLPTNAFCFGGFLPNKSGPRRTYLKSFSQTPCTLVFYESPNRLTDSLIDIHAVLGDVTLAIIRELTKKFEEVRRGQVSNLIQYYEQSGNPKGEIVLVIGHAAEQLSLSDADIDRRLTALLKTLPVKDAAKQLATEFGLSKNDLYKRALSLRPSFRTGSATPTLDPESSFIKKSKP